MIFALVLSFMCHRNMMNVGADATPRIDADTDGFSDIAPKDDDTWYADWIWDAGNDSDSWVQFRKKIWIEDESKIADATARIAADSKYWLYINGEMVVREGGQKRGQNKYSTYYDTVDLSEYLTEGENTIAVMVWYWGPGNSKSYYTSGRAAFCFQMQCGDRLVLSDENWKVNRSLGFSNIYNQANYRLAEKDIVYNAATMEEGWFLADYDDSAWAAATVYGHAGDEPWGELIERTIPQWKDYGLKDYENASDYVGYVAKENTTLALEIPYNAQFTPYLKIKAKEGDCITIKTDEYADNNGNSVMCTYYARDGLQEFESYGWMNGEIVYYEIPAGVEIVSLQYRETGYDCEFAGGFTCDDSFYNTLWEKARRTLYVNMRDTYMDCPNRERAQWWGDTSLDMLIAMYCMNRDADLLYESGIDTILGWQDNNIFYTVTPEYKEEDSLQLQNLWGVISFWNYYEYTGDESFLAEIYEPAKNYMSFWTAKEDGLYTYDLQSPRLDWGDSTDGVDYPPLENAWYYYAMRTMRDIAVLNGEADDAAAYEEMMASLKETYQNTYWTDDGFWSGETDTPDERANAIAVLSGIADKSQYDTISHVFETSFQCTPFLEYFVETACIQIGRADLAQMRMKTQYADMITGADADKTSTLWEYWTYGQGTSNHAWSGGPLVLMSRDFAGIAPLTAGYETYQIKPMLGELTAISTSTETVRGKISVSIQKEENSISVAVDAPNDLHGVIAIPKNGINMVITADGDEEGVYFSSEDEEYIYFNVNRDVTIHATW